MKKEDITFLNQLVLSLEEAEEKLEESYKNKDHEEFLKTKRFILKIQKQIGEIIK
jgi:hypothetical protein